MGLKRLRRLVDVENCGLCALPRSKSVTRLELETIPLELKTMCRIPGMREMLRKFQGRLHLRSWGMWCLVLATSIPSRCKQNLKRSD